MPVRKTYFAFQILIATFLLLCCNEKKEKKEKKFEDYPLDIQIEARRKTDSLLQATTKNALFDTAGLYLSPVKVIKARLVKKEYSNYRDISLSYKNVSGKVIEGIRFRWYGENAFGEPADLGSSGLYNEGFGSGFSDERLMPGRTSSGEWSILSIDAKKIVLAWPYEVAFKDGTKWKL
jgi:hypothetical protein